MSAEPHGQRRGWICAWQGTTSGSHPTRAVSVKVKPATSGVCRGARHRIMWSATETVVSVLQCP